MNTNNYDGKSGRSGLNKIFIFWGFFLVVLIACGILAFNGTSSATENIEWTISELETALSFDNNAKTQDQVDFANEYQFDNSRMLSLTVNVDSIISSANVTYFYVKDVETLFGVQQKQIKVKATTKWVTYDNPDTTNHIETLYNNFVSKYKENKNIVNKDFKYDLVDEANKVSVWGVILQYLPTVIFIIIVIVLFRAIIKSQGKESQDVMFFGKSKAKLEDTSKIRFTDVAGCDDEKAEMAELVDYLKNPNKYSKAGARIPKGIILKGQPGTGKTLLAKAVAGEANVPFFYISGSDFLEMYVGVGAARVRDMFKQARESAPCIVFIDEIDAIGRQRGTGLGGGHDEREQTLNQMLVEMDGFEGNSGVIVLAATNRIDILDPALLRPGRFDRQIEVSLPDLKGRVEILKVHSRNKKLASDVSLDSIAARTPGFSGAELENVLNEAAILSVRNGHSLISSLDIDDAIDRVISGPAKKTKVISERSKRITAYHEAGHALIGLKIESASVVQKITIIPRGNAYGYVMMTPKDESVNKTKKELLAQITSFLAGRASEEIYFDDVTTGAYDDIDKATRIARAMVTEFGMTDAVGPVHYEDNDRQVFLGRDYGSTKISAETAEMIDLEVRKIINQCLELAKKTINENKDLVELIAEALIKYETITADDVNFLVQYRSLDAYDLYKQNSEHNASGSGNEVKVETPVEDNENQEDSNNEN